MLEEAMVWNKEHRIAAGREVFAGGFGGRRLASGGLGTLPVPLLIFGAALVFWLAYYRSAFGGLYINDAQDYASIARNIALGRGVISQYITPLGLAHHGVPQPDLWRAPLWPLVLAGFQRIFGFTDRASALAGGACHVAAACLVFLLGRRWFNTPVALSASALFLCSARILEFSISGLTEPLAVLLMLFWLYLLTAPFGVTPWGALLAGFALGLFYLARYNAILFLIPGLAFLVWRHVAESRGRRPQALQWQLSTRPGDAAQMPGNAARTAVPCFRRGLSRSAGFVAAALFLAGFLLVTSPWLVRNQVVAGSPFFSLQKYEPAMFTRTYPGYSLYMLPVRVDVPRFLIGHRGEVLEKFLRNFADFRSRFLYRDFTGFPLRVFACSLLALALSFDRFYPAQRGVRPLLLACFLLQLAALLFLHYIPRLFMIFTPFYALYAAGAVWFLGERLSGLVAGMIEAVGATPALQAGGVAAGRRGYSKGFPAVAAAVVLAAFTLLGAGANIPDFHPDFGPHPTSLWGEALRDVREFISPSEVVISDNGQIFAWYGERFSCKLPYSPELLPEVSRLAPVRALFLTSWITWAQPDADPAWIEVFRRKPAFLEGLRLAKVYPDGSLLYLREPLAEEKSP